MHENYFSLLNILNVHVISTTPSHPNILVPTRCSTGVFEGSTKFSFFLFLHFSPFHPSVFSSQWHHMCVQFKPLRWVHTSYMQAKIMGLTVPEHRDSLQAINKASNEIYLLFVRYVALNYIRHKTKWKGSTLFVVTLTKSLRISLSPLLAQITQREFHRMQNQYCSRYCH